MPNLYLFKSTRFWQSGFRCTSLLVIFSLVAGCQLAKFKTPQSKGAPLTTTKASMQVSEIDTRAYRAVTLDNGLEVLLISDPTTDKAAAAMDVAVGSGSDPAGREGMAHFLEHMLFLGTEKFPEAGEYQAFINQHGGSHNAYTTYDHTNYFFDVDADALEAALDRFSQQFVAPLFTAAYVDRERNAVHSEYTSKLKDDSRRFFSVLQAAMDPAHPMAKFSVGNLETLSDKDGKSIREDLLAFYNQHYSSHIMRLVVYGKEPLDQLDTWVKTRFSAVARRDVAKRTRSDQAMFRTADLPLLVTTTPIKEKRSLSLLFTMPAVEPYYHTKPLYYLSHLLGHEGEGSLLSWLKSQNLAEGLSAGLFSSDQQEAIFSISVQLTPEGRQHYQQIIDATFAYIDLMKSSPVEEWRFDEQRIMLETAFRFQDKIAPIQYVSGLANRLHDYPANEVLVAPYLMDRFDEKLIRSYMERLDRNSLVTVLVAPDVDTQKKERWYDAPYALSTLPTSTGVVASEVEDALELPEPNPFIPSDLTLLSGASMKIPAPLSQAEGLEAWYAQDLSFNSPKASYYLSLRTPITNDSARDVVLTELFISMAREELNEFAYPAYLAGLDFKLYKHQRGVTLRIDGFSDKQPELLNQILETLTDFNYDQALFDRFHKEMQRDLRNSLQNKPFERLAVESRAFLLDPYWSEKDQLKALESITLADLRSFVPELWQNMNAVTLAMGNLSQDQAARANEVVEARLLDGKNIVAVPKSQVVRMKDPLIFSEITTIHPDAAYLLYVQGRDKSYRDRATMGLISQIIAPSYYTQIRTEAQMGYVVFATPFTLMEVPGLAFIVQSPSHTPAQIDEATRQFMSAFAKELNTMPAEVFARHKEAMLTRLLEEDKTLEQRADRYWTEIDTGNPAFNTTERIAEQVRQLSKSDIEQAFAQLFLNDPRALLVVAYPETAQSTWMPKGARLVEDRAEVMKTNERFPQ